MAARVTALEVKSIITTSVTDLDIEVFINAANITVTKYLSTETTLSTAQLKEIERWLAAHFMACTKEQKVISEDIGGGDYKAVYQGETGKGLDATFYGQQVKVLDSSGILASSLGKKKATLMAVTSFN